MQSSMKLGESVYANSDAEGAQTESDNSSSSEHDEKVVDAVRKV